MKLKYLLIIIVTTLLSVLVYSFEYSPDNNSIKVYPQPIRTTTTVQCDFQIDKIEVYNLLGSLILEQTDEPTLDFSRQQSGYYIIKVYTPKGEFLKRVQKL